MPNPTEKASHASEEEHDTRPATESGAAAPNRSINPEATPSFWRSTRKHQYDVMLALGLSVIVHLALIVGPLIPLQPIEIPSLHPLKPLSVQLQAMSLSTATTRSDKSRPAGHITIAPPLASAKKTTRPRTESLSRHHNSSATSAANSPTPNSDLVTSVAPQQKDSAELNDDSGITIPQDDADQGSPDSALAETAAPIASSPVAAAETSSQSTSSNQYLSAQITRRRFPDRVRIRYQVFYGELMAGTATLDWQRNGKHYSLESLITPIFGPRLRYISEGSLNYSGLQPKTFLAWRNDTAREYASFHWQTKQLEYGDNEVHYAPLRNGAQDIFSVMYQLALKGADASEQSIQVTTGKKVRDYTLSPIGETDFDAGNGKMRAIVIRSDDADAFTEFWLAPGFANQPIRVKRVDKNLQLDMRAVGIMLNGKIEWQLPKAPKR